jgi:hypothetical protein
MVLELSLTELVLVLELTLPEFTLVLELLLAKLILPGRSPDDIDIQSEPGHLLSSSQSNTLYRCC